MHLSSLFSGVQTVVLQGWGEPLLYPHLIDAIAAVKGKGAQAGFVTSGHGLDAALCRALIDAGTDFIGFSLGGATSATHNAIRVRSDLDSLLCAIGTLTRLKSEAKSAVPRLHITYLVVRDNIEEAPDVVDLAASLGVEEVFFIHLVHVVTEWQESQRVFGCREGNEEEAAAFDRLMKEAAERARRHRIRLRAAPGSPLEVGVCEENPLRNLYIGVDGEVSPCVFLAPPTRSPFKRLFCGREILVEKVSYGNVLQQDFDALWNGTACREFRQSFSLRKARFREIYALWSQEKTRRKQSSLPAPPPPCLTCHKMLGF